MRADFLVSITRRRRSGARGGRVIDVRHAVAMAFKLEHAFAGEVSVLLTDDQEIRALNHRFRGIDKPTDVLAFPTAAEHDAVAHRFWGDIVLSMERAKAQARSRKVHWDLEIELLLVHGALHLLGYDHLRVRDARCMRAATRRIRTHLHRRENR